MAQECVSPILITGVGKRLGLGLAQHFLAQGIPVIGTYRSSYPVLAELEKSGAVLFQCDFYQQASVEALIKHVKEHCQSLRAIIHNASDWIPESADLEPADILAKMMQVHVSAPYQLNLALAPLLEASADLELSTDLEPSTDLDSSAKAPRDIIHFTDYVCDKGSKKHIAYAASKAALTNMTLSFAAALAPKVKVNAVAPALVLFNDADSSEYKEKAVKKALIEKEGGMQEVIAAVDYLLCSEYVTGRTMHLDGGRHLK